MKRIVLVGALVLAMFLVGGCVSPYYGQYEREGAEAVTDSLLAPSMAIADVIALTKDSVSDDVIISQIKATRSFFSLTTDDILVLKKAGVSEKVITTMIKSGVQPRYIRRQRRYAYYPSYYYPYYHGYPWYSSFSLGYYPYSGHGYYGGYYGGGHRYYGGQGSGGYGFGGGYYSGGHGSSGHRSVGRHR